MSKRLFYIVSLTISAACRTTGPVAPERIETAEAAIRGADSSGAANVSEANSYLQMAHQELADGKQLSDRGWSHRSELALERATDDAKLSTTIAQKEKLDRENVEIGKQLNTPR